jgi:transposase
MSLVYLKNKKSGVTYVYECQSFWNKEKKRPDSIRKCIGKLDPETNEIISTKQAQSTKPTTVHLEPTIATIKIIGPTLLLDHICKKIGLDSILKKSFPEHWNMILSLAYFQTIEGKALSRVEHWSETHRHPYLEYIDNRRVSELLPTITEEKQLSFFKKWAEKRLEEECLAYDITSVSSYSEQNNMVRYGYNRDGESLPQINLAMLFGEKTRLPVYFKSLPGSIKDVSTLCNFIKTAAFLHMRKLHLVMDKGFYSQKNVDEMLGKHMKFTIAVPFSSKFAKEHVEKVRDEITDHKNFIKVNGQNLFCISSLTQWGEEKKRCYVHVFYNASNAAADYESFLDKMNQWEIELKSNKMIEDHQKYYDQYFLIKDTPKRGKQISYNQSVIDAYKKNAAGYLVLLSNDIKDPIEALKAYRNKDVVEKGFDNLKNRLDMKRLRVHLEASMKGRLFIQFIALILISYIQQVINKQETFKFDTVSELLEELELLNTVKFASHYGQITSELTKKQKEIFVVFDLDPKTYV